MKKMYMLIIVCIVLSFAVNAKANTLREQLYQEGQSYIKFYVDDAITGSEQGSLEHGAGFTRSFQIDLGSHIDPANLLFINYGASSYDQTILGRINLASGNRDTLDAYVYYSQPAQLADSQNPLLNTNGNYTDQNGNPILYGPYRIVRILGRDLSNWWENWDWIVDTGGAAALILYACEAYDQTSIVEYKNFAILLASYILQLQDNDGGVRYAPVGVWNPAGDDYYWRLKSTEQNERCMYAMEALYSITSDQQYQDSAENIKEWLISMYDIDAHLFYPSAYFDGSIWQKPPIYDYVPTDVTAFAPIGLMFEDAFFGATEQDRANEVDLMFNAIEERNAFFNAENEPVFFKFSLGQIDQHGSDEFGTVEISAQMALAYLRAVRKYTEINNGEMIEKYTKRYDALINSLESFFMSPEDNPDSKIAPYASYLDKSVAGNAATGTGTYTYNTQGALASAFYAFAKVGFDTTKIGGGLGRPAFVLNMTEVPWYSYNDNSYNSTGAAVGQMILNYMILGAQEDGASADFFEYPQGQNIIYDYAKSGALDGEDLTAAELDLVLGHFDPYDEFISNEDDDLDLNPGGNPRQGYNFTVASNDPLSDPQAINHYMRGICHWMAYNVTKEYWRNFSELVARPNTPSAIPLYGSYDNWVTVKGYAASANPCPYPATNPGYTPDFTVYGFWLKDPKADEGIGVDTYKTAAECVSTYFLPVNSEDKYNGKYVQVAEPPIEESSAKIDYKKPERQLKNLIFSGVENEQTKKELSRKSTITVYNMNWQDLLDEHMLNDKDAVECFKGRQKGEPVLVKRYDKSKADYYLVPFGEKRKQGFFATGVIILDAEEGYFKEASWCKTPEKFLKISRKDSERLIRRYILKNFIKDLIEIINSKKHYNWPAIRSLYLRYIKLLSYVKKADYQLTWTQSKKNPGSVYRPDWKVNIKGYICMVSQDSTVKFLTDLDDILNTIKNNIIKIRILTK